MRNPFVWLKQNTDDAKLLEAVDKAQAVISFTPEGAILDANDNFLKTMGYAREELRGKHHRMFMPPKAIDSQEYSDFWDSLRRGQFVSGEIARIRKGGQTVWLQATYYPLRDGGGKVTRIVKLGTDVSAARNKSNDDLAQLVAIDRSQAVIEFDPDGLVLKANKNFLDVMGYTLNEIAGQHHRMFVDKVDQNGSDYLGLWERLRSGAFESRQWKRLAKGGREVWIQASYNPVLDADGRVTKVVKFASDITEEVKRTARIERAHETDD